MENVMMEHTSIDEGDYSRNARKCFHFYKTRRTPGTFLSTKDNPQGIQTPLADRMIHFKAGCRGRGCIATASGRITIPCIR